MTSDATVLAVAIDSLKEWIQRQESSLEERMQNQERLLQQLLRRTKAQQLLPGGSFKEEGSLLDSLSGKICTDDEGEEEVEEVEEEAQEKGDLEAGTAGSDVGSPVRQASSSNAVPRTPGPPRQLLSTAQRSPSTPQRSGTPQGIAGQQSPAGRQSSGVQQLRQLQRNTIAGGSGGGSSSSLTEGQIPQHPPWRY